jgi:hypothetical protein
MIYQWNRLHEAMAELLADIVSKDNQQVPRAIWYSNPSDRTQRAMLRAAIDAAHIATSPKPRIHADVVWLLNQLDGLAGKRNVAFHSPLVFVNDLHADTIEILPMYFFGNPHATQLRDKSLPEEFKWYRDHLSRLAGFAEMLHFATTFPEFGWPDRPQLPPRGHFRSPGPKRRKKSPNDLGSSYHRCQDVLSGIFANHLMSLTREGWPSGLRQRS